MQEGREVRRPSRRLSRRGIIALFCLNGTVKRTLADYMCQKKEGKDPKFVAKDAGVKNTTPGIWD